MTVNKWVGKVLVFGCILLATSCVSKPDPRAACEAIVDDFRRDILSQTPLDMQLLKQFFDDRVIPVNCELKCTPYIVIAGVPWEENYKLSSRLVQEIILVEEIPPSDVEELFDYLREHKEELCLQGVYGSDEDRSAEESDVVDAGL